MDISVKIRKKNWPVIAALLKQSERLDRDEIRLAKACYIGSERNTFFHEYQFAQLIASTPDLFEEIVDQSAKDYKNIKSLLAAFNSLFNNKLFYFGDNSICCYKEHYIFDSFTGYSEDDLNRDLSWCTERFGEDAEKILWNPLERHFYWNLKVPQHIPKKFSLVYWKNRLNATGKKTKYHSVDFNKNENILMVEAAVRFEGSVDPLAVKQSREIRDHIDSNETPDVIRDLYQAIIERDFQEFSQENHFGGKIFACAKYNNMEHLESALCVIDPEKRPPFEKDRPHGMIYRLRKDRESRPSHSLMLDLWEVNAVYSNYEVLDEKYLIIQIEVGLRFKSALNAVSVLAIEISDVLKKYSSAKPLPDDKFDNDYGDYGREVSYVVQDLDGSLSIGLLNGGLMDCKYRTDNFPELATLAAEHPDPRQLAIICEDRKVRKMIRKLQVRVCRTKHSI